MIDVRSQGIPVVDLKRKLALPETATTEHTRLLVLEVTRPGRQLVVAALADAVHEVAQLTGDALDPPPEFGEAWDTSFMHGIGRRHGAFVTLLDLERVFRSHDLDLVEPAR
jgi:purine-binding chemotaxis protein CheW